MNQALVNSEVTEVSNKAILQELQDAQATITRLTAHHARSIGWDTRLSAALRERDDMQQERDAETHRARLAESRFAVLKDKTGTISPMIYNYFFNNSMVDDTSQIADRSTTTSRKLGRKTTITA